jgi:hypothetical protein
MTTQWTPEDEAEAQVRDAVRATQKAAAADPPIQDLVTQDDPDWGAYQSDDPDWFLRAAGRTIRKYVGWHIYPNIQETRHKIRTGSRGIIMLPSRHVTEVDKLFIRMSEDLPPQWVAKDDYIWHQAGYIERRGWAYYTGWYYAGYYYGNDPYYLPVWETGFATCTFWHGYTTLPEDVKEVAFELAEQSMTVRAGNVKMLEAPGGYKAQTSQNFGLSLNPEQKNRLASYRVGGVG